jgi:hypothetical protein
MQPEKKGGQKEKEERHGPIKKKKKDELRSYSAVIDKFVNS